MVGGAWLVVGVMVAMAVMAGVGVTLVVVILVGAVVGEGAGRKSRWGHDRRPHVNRSKPQPAVTVATHDTITIRKRNI